MLLKATKTGKVRCPVCNKLQHPYHDDEKDVMVLECCKIWSLYPREVAAIEEPEEEDRGALLRSLYEGRS